MERQEISLDELYATYTSNEQIRESFEKRIVPTGTYTFQASRAQAVVASEQSPWPGRKMASFFGALKDAEGKRKGSIGFDAAWDVTKTPKGRLDGPSRLWGQLVTALGDKLASVAVIIENAGRYPLSVYVTESYKTAEGWRTPKTEEEKSQYKQQGYEPRNFVNGISKAR